MLAATVPRAAVMSAVLLAACADVDVLADERYDDRFGAAASMDVYLPGDADPADPRPAVVLVHGGGWRAFSKEVYFHQGMRLARSGYVAASINYRLVPEARGEALVQDCFCALAHLRQHAAEYAIDPARIAVMGYSAGGHLVSLMGLAADVESLQSDDCPAGRTGPPAAVITGAGPQELRELSFASSVTDYVGGTPESVPERYDLLSPIVHARALADATPPGVSPAVPPFLFVHGSSDVFVPIQQSRDAREVLAAAGARAQILEIPAGGHVLTQGTDNGTHYFLLSTDTPVAWAVIADFLAGAVGAP